MLIRRLGNGIIPGKYLMKNCGLTAIVLLCALSAFAQDNVETTMKRSIEANERDWAAAPELDYLERDRDPGGSKTYAVIMLFGSPYQRLIAVNEHPLSRSKKAEEQKKFEKAVAERRSESPEKRSERVAKYEAERKRDHTMMQQLTMGFDFNLLGQQQLKGHKVYVLKATPRKGYRPPDRDSKVLTGMEGKMWVDRSTFQWVKVEAHVTHPVSIEGFLAEVEPGTEFELEKSPVSGDIWLATHFSMKSNAKVMHLVSRHSQQDITYFNYHRGEAAGKQPLAPAR